MYFWKRSRRRTRGPAAGYRSGPRGPLPNADWTIRNMKSASRGLCSCSQTRARNNVPRTDAVVLGSAGISGAHWKGDRVRSVGMMFHVKQFLIHNSEFEFHSSFRILNSSFTPNSSFPTRPLLSTSPFPLTSYFIIFCKVPRSSSITDSSPSRRSFATHPRRWAAINSRLKAFRAAPAAAD